MMYTMPKNLLSICVNFTLATQHHIDNILLSLTYQKKPDHRRGHFYP